jgi:hypothetical protein
MAAVQGINEFLKNFCVYGLIWAEFGIRVVNVTLLSVSLVHENWQREGHAFYYQHK